MVKNKQERQMEIIKKTNRKFALGHAQTEQTLFLYSLQHHNFWTVTTLQGSPVPNTTTLHTKNFEGCYTLKLDIQKLRAQPLRFEAANGRSTLQRTVLDIIFISLFITSYACMANCSLLYQRTLRRPIGRVNIYLGVDQQISIRIL